MTTAELKDKEGWVYVVRALGTNRYKVGRSCNPLIRKKQLTKQSPYPLKMLDKFFTLDAVYDESRIHHTFKESRVFGEWFEFSDCEATTNFRLYQNGSNRFWYLSDTLFIEIDKQLDRLFSQDKGEIRRLIREELMTLVQNTLSKGNKKAYYRVINQLIPESLNKCYFHEYQYITGNKMSDYEYILGTLIGINLALTT